MNTKFYKLSIEAFKHGINAANPEKCLKEAIELEKEISKTLILKWEYFIQNHCKKTYRMDVLQ